MLDMLSILATTLPCLFVVARAVLLDRQLPWFRVEAGETAKAREAAPSGARRG